jgi:4-hydroxy-4-methyl-2-oxoglutarate aldolase
MKEINNVSMQELSNISPCEYAEKLTREQFVDYKIKQMWTPMPRIAGPAFTVKCGQGDHLSLHAAIYQAQAGDILVVETDGEFATTGGNVCAIAQQRGIKGMVIDGLIRDLAEIRGLKFPLYARGVMPKPAKKEQMYPFNQTIICGGVTVNAGDIVVADEDGIAIIPQAQLMTVYQAAKLRTDADAAMNLAQWQAQHQKKVNSKLQGLGYYKQ